MVINLPNPNPDHRSATKEVSRIISAIQQSRNSSVMARSEFGRRAPEGCQKKCSSKETQYVRKTSKSPPEPLVQLPDETKIKDVPPLGRTMAMHEEEGKLQQSTVYSGDFKTIDPELLREIALENSKGASSQSGLFAKTENRNQPGGSNITHLKSANGDQATFINNVARNAPFQSQNPQLVIRYTAPTFSSDVIGRQGAPFVQPEDSSYNSQFKFFSLDPEVKARPLSIYKRSQRNCPNAKGASNIMMHNGQFMRVFDNGPQLAPVNPFDTRVSKAGCRSSLLNKTQLNESVEEKLKSPLFKMSSKDHANAITASEAATDAYKREQKINSQEYRQNKTSGWRWGAEQRLSPVTIQAAGR